MPALASRLDARAQRGFTLIEVMIVVALVGIIVALAMPSLRPLSDVNKLTGRAEVIAGFVDDARRLSYNLGVCHKLRLNSGDLELLQRSHSDCTSVATDTAADWDGVARRTQQGGNGFLYAIKATGTLTDEIVLRPSSRLYGDGDLDVSDDGARITVRYSNTGRFKSIDITPLGRVCVRDWGTTDPPMPTGALTCP